MEIRQAKAIVDEAPLRVEAIEQRFRERNAEYVAVQERLEELELDQRTRSGELTELEERRKKYMEDLMGVKNQREYAAMLKEIDVVKAQISGHEEAILVDMEEIEKLREDLETRTAHIEAERKLVDEERAKVDGEEAEAAKIVDTRSTERVRIEGELPASLAGQVRTLESTRQGIFLTPAENGTCQSCFVRVRPQVFQEIKAATIVHTCASCRRFLYFERSLRPVPAETGGRASVEVVDGGAV